MIASRTIFANIFGDRTAITPAIVTGPISRICGANSATPTILAPWSAIGCLSRAFNHMSERLAVQFDQLEEDRHQLRTILSGMVEGVVALDAEQRILFANERAAQLLQLPRLHGLGFDRDARR